MVRENGLKAPMWCTLPIVAPHQCFKILIYMFIFRGMGLALSTFVRTAAQTVTTLSRGTRMKLRKTVIAIGLASLGASVSLGVQADEEKSPHSVTGNLTLTTDYIVRGLSQTGRKPAVQGTLEYGHASGLYAGTFWSNISFPGDFFGRAAPGVNGAVYGGNSDISASLEIDLYGGFRNKIGEDLGYDVGYVYYYYPGRYKLDTGFTNGLKTPNTAEVYVAGSWKWITAKLYWAVTDGVFMIGDAKGTYYADLSATYPIAEGINLVGHIGTWRFNGEMQAYKNLGLKNDVFNVVDWKVGATADWGGITWGAYYWRSNAKETVTGTAPVAVWADRFGEAVGDGQFFVTATKAF